MIESLTIENFTAFRKVKFEFVPGINVFIGANASGKTHVMKLLYVMQKLNYVDNTDKIQYLDILLNVFNPESVENLVRLKSRPVAARVSANWRGAAHPYTMTLGDIVSLYEESGIGRDGIGEPAGDATLRPSNIINGGGPRWQGVPAPVFIPVNDMLAHSVGFLSLYDQRYVDFDETQRNILSLALLPTLRDNERKQVNPLLDKLADKMEGRVEVKGERFYINGEKGRFEMHLVAAGWRKIALLYQLIANGSLAAGTVLYWDEPEANLNPSLMDEVVGVLLELSRIGVQIFLATHSYIILKEMELQKQQEDSLQLYAMARNKNDGSVSIHPAASYGELHPNLIAEQFERIYDMEVDRALGKQ